MVLFPSIRFLKRRSTVLILGFIGGVLGDLPDLIGVWGSLVRHDRGALYFSAHTGSIKHALQWMPMYWLHLYLDSFTHKMEDRWSLWNEWVGFEVVAWIINIVLIAVLIYLWRRFRVYRQARDTVGLSGINDSSRAASGS